MANAAEAASAEPVAVCRAVRRVSKSAAFLTAAAPASKIGAVRRAVIAVPTPRNRLPNPLTDLDTPRIVAEKLSSAEIRILSCSGFLATDLSPLHFGPALDDANPKLQIGCRHIIDYIG